MQTIINIARVASVAFVTLIVVAMPIASVRAADLPGDYTVDTFYPNYDYSVDTFYPSTNYDYSVDTFYPNYNYSVDTFYPDYNYSVDTFYPSYDYSVDTFYPSTNYDYSVDTFYLNYPEYSGSYSNSSAYASASAYSYGGGSSYNYNYNYNTGCKKNCTPSTPKPKPSCDLTISPSHVDYKDDATIHWSSNNATSATLTGFGSVSTSGSRTVHNITSNKTYTLTVTGPGGSATCSDTVTVTHEYEDVDCRIKASDTTIDRGDKVKLTWSSDNADYGYISPDIGNVNENGSETVRPYDTTTYKGTFYNYHGDKATCSVKVTVRNDHYYPPVYVPPTTPYITLSAVPYTGLELGPVGTAVYWSLLALWCLFAAYLIAVKKVHVAIARRIKSFLFGADEVVVVAPVVTAHAHAPAPAAHAHVVHDTHTDSTDEFVLSQLRRGLHAH